ncbi:MAG: hypothetical protein AAF385_17075 [Pseudomonadota bacterium]
MLEIRNGERVFVLGANGTGKSALLNKIVREGGGEGPASRRATSCWISDWGD